LVLFLLTVLQGARAGAQDATADAGPDPEKVQQSIDRALAFLVEDAAKWRKERGCATCHHGEMTVWALSEARDRGYAVPAETLAETIRWTKELFVPQFSKPRDHRWGYNFVSLPGIYLSVMSETLPILSRDEIDRLAVHLARHQEEDGAWLMPPPNANTSPPTWESSETIALWALLAWESPVGDEGGEAATVRAAREKAVAWLGSTKPTDTTQALSLRLLLDIHTRQAAESLRSRVEQLLRRQNADGGWSQLEDLASDAYATGQVLWALSFAGVRPEHAQIRRGISFLVASQQDQGAWPMTGRSHPGTETKKERNPVPITYFGSAWATLGLVRFVPPLLDPATREARAFEWLRSFSGTYETDQALPGTPVVSIKVRYEIDDDQLAKMVRLLGAFRQLRSLQLKSMYITDAGARHLKPLAQLRSLSLEDSNITDAGLAELKGLSDLEELGLKGTNVTDAAVEDFRRGLPRVKIER